MLRGHPCTWHVSQTGEHPGVEFLLGAQRSRGGCDEDTGVRIVRHPDLAAFGGLPQGPAVEVGVDGDVGPLGGVLRGGV
ncbi:MAG: hypothetical protein L0L02_01360, partial [Corynebacterium variabile]|nr:hypothetical protein [Corynebacterium variabile]